MKTQLIQEIRNALSLDNFSEALNKAQQLVALDPSDADAYLLYGEVFLAMENGAQAAEQCQKAIALQPDNASAYFNLGIAQELLDDATAALNQYQTARRLDPQNNLYQASFGRLLNDKGIATGNTNYQNEGLALMEQAFLAGTRNPALHEQLAIAHLAKATENWRQHPEQPDMVMPTDKVHLEHTKIHLGWVRNLHDPANQAIAQRLIELENLVRINEQKQFAGYPYLRKAPVIVGTILAVFGMWIPAALLLLMAGLYHVSQLKPVYLINRMQFPGEFRHPLIVRRLDQMDQLFAGVTFFDTSLSRLLFNKFLFGLGIKAIRYLMIIVILPFEITKGFLMNHGLKEQLMAKMRA